MSLSTKPATLPPTSKRGGSRPTPTSLDRDSRSQSGQFVAIALTMSWQLAVIVLVPMLAGVALDRGLGTKYVFTFIGLVVAIAGMVVVLWRTLQTANQLPVPKLTEAQKREVQERYAEDDADD